MSRISRVNRRYEAVQSILANGVSIFAVEDSQGARLNRVMQDIRVLDFQTDDGPLDELIRMVGILRWRRITEPLPSAFSPQLFELAEQIAKDSNQLRDFVGMGALLQDLADAVDDVVRVDSAVGAELLQSIEEVGNDACVVVAARSASRLRLQGWLAEVGARVVVPSELNELSNDVEISYVVGPPSFLPHGLFPRGLVTSPITQEVTFLTPSWFAPRAYQSEECILPASEFGELAEGKLNVRARIYLVGSTSDVDPDTEVREVEGDYFPQPNWGPHFADEREATSDEVRAWKVLLSGERALWLDDGERIRSLDPFQPAGDRVGNEAVDAVRPGTFLVLREGATEHGAMHAAALAGMGERANEVANTQKEWKKKLADRLEEYGLVPSINALKLRGVASASRVKAWTEPTLICPRRTEDLRAVLEWLGLQKEPTLTNATSLRRSLYKASVDLGRELELAVDTADLEALQQNGTMSLDLDREGFRGMLVSRVIARSPFTQLVPRQKTRIPFKDGGAKWLE